MYAANLAVVNLPLLLFIRVVLVALTCCTHSDDVGDDRKSVQYTRSCITYKHTQFDFTNGQEAN